MHATAGPPHSEVDLGIADLPRLAQGQYRLGAAGVAVVDAQGQGCRASWPGSSTGSTGWPTGCASRVTEPSGASSASTRSCMRSATARPQEPDRARSTWRARSCAPSITICATCTSAVRRSPSWCCLRLNDHIAGGPQHLDIKNMTVEHLLPTQARCQQPVARSGSPIRRARQVHRVPRQPGADDQGTERQGEQPRLRAARRTCCSICRARPWWRSTTIVRHQSEWRVDADRRAGSRAAAPTRRAVGVSADPLAARQVVPPRSPAKRKEPQAAGA